MHTRDTKRSRNDISQRPSLEAATRKSPRLKKAKIEPVIESATVAKKTTEKKPKPKRVKPEKETEKKSKAATETSDSSAAAAYGVVKKGSDGITRCWGFDNVESKMCQYHDTDWGRPETDPDKLFEHMCLQTMQSGLNWTTILNKRETLRAAFSDFKTAKVAKFDDADFERLMQDAGIIRNKLKVHAVINNAKMIEKLKKDHDFSKWIWKLAPTSDDEIYLSKDEKDFKDTRGHMRTDFKTTGADRFKADGVHPTVSVAKMAKTLKDHGFKFLGPATLLSFMQVTGMVNHHKTGCYAFDECTKERTAALKKLGLSR